MEEDPTGTEDNSIGIGAELELTADDEETSGAAEEIGGMATELALGWDE